MQTSNMSSTPSAAAAAAAAVAAGSKYTSTDDVSDAERYAGAALLGVITLLSLGANVSLWAAVLATRGLRRESNNVLLLSLSLADVLVSAVSMPVTTVTIYLARWVFSEQTCTVMGFITMLTLVSSVMSLGLISINRYIKICRPGSYTRVYTKRNIALMTLGVWLLSAALSSPPLMGWCVYDYLPQQSFCFCDWSTSASYTFFMMAVCFGGPILMMTVSNVRILQTYSRSQRNVRQLKTTCQPPKNRVQGVVEEEARVPENLQQSSDDGTLWQSRDPGNPVQSRVSESLEQSMVPERLESVKTWDTRRGGDPTHSREGESSKVSVGLGACACCACDNSGVQTGSKKIRGDGASASGSILVGSNMCWLGPRFQSVEHAADAPQPADKKPVPAVTLLVQVQPVLTVTTASPDPAEEEREEKHLHEYITDDDLVSSESAAECRASDSKYCTRLAVPETPTKSRDNDSASLKSFTDSETPAKWRASDSTSLTRLTVPETPTKSRDNDSASLKSFTDSETPAKWRASDSTYLTRLAVPETPTKSRDNDSASLKSFTDSETPAKWRASDSTSLTRLTDTETPPGDGRRAVSTNKGKSRSSRGKSATASARQQKKEKQRAEEFRLAVSLMVVIVTFVLCWFPFCVTMLLSVFAPHALNRAADQFTLLLGYSNSCLNPIIYGVMNKRVKEGYVGLWRRMCRYEQRFGADRTFNSQSVT